MPWPKMDHRVQSLAFMALFQSINPWKHASNIDAMQLHLSIVLSPRCYWTYCVYACCKTGMPRASCCWARISACRTWGMCFPWWSSMPMPNPLPQQAIPLMDDICLIHEHMQRNCGCCTDAMDDQGQFPPVNLMLCYAGVHCPTSAVCILSDACPTQQQQQ